MPTEVEHRQNGGRDVRVRPRSVPVVLGLIAGYVITARLGLLLALPPEQKATAVWPPSGIALATVLFFGPRAWPGVWFGAFLANLWDFFLNVDPVTLAPHVGVSSGIATGSTLQTLAGAALLHRWAAGTEFLNGPRRVFAFIAIALSVCTVAASLGVASLWLGGFVPGSAAGAIWWTWWLGDATGIVLVTPLLLAWARRPVQPPEGSRLEAAILLAVVLGTGLLVFGSAQVAGVTPMAYLTIPLLIWATVRFGPRGATATLVLVSGLAVWGTANGLGPFVRATLNESLVLLQVFMAVVALTTLVLAAALTERRIAADALAASEERYRVLTEAMPHMVWTMTPDGTLTYLNGRVTAFTGLSVEAINAGGWAPLVHPDDAPRVSATAPGPLERGEPHEVEYRFRHHTGEYRWVVSTAVPRRDDTGAVVAWVGSTRDIHDRKVAENQLRASERRYRALVEATPQVVWRVGGTGNQIAGLWSDLTGQTAEESAGWGWLDAVHPDDRERVRETWTRAFETRGRYDTGYRVRTRTGGYRYFAVRGVPLIDAAGQLEEWVGTLTDVHDRTVAEERLRELNASLERRVADRTAELRASAAFSRGVLDSLPAHIAVVDRDGTVTAVNRAWERFSEDHPGTPGLATRVGVGTNYLGALDASAAHGGADAGRAAAAVRRVLAGGGPWSGLEYDRPVPGRTYWFSMSATPLATAGGAVVTHTDITPQKRAEEAVRESEERFRSAFEFAPIGIALVDPTGRWLKVNRSLCELVGYDEPELLATDFQTLTHPDDLTADLALVRRTLAGEIQTYQMEKRYFHKSGRTVYALLSVSLVRDATAAPLYFISQIKDITQRKEAERALAANDALLRQFIRHSPAAIAMFDREVRYIQASNRWLADYHLVGQEIVGRSYYEVLPDVPDRWRAVHRRVLAGAVERCDEDPFHRADGSTEWFEWECRPWHRADEEIGGLVIFTQVITQRKLAAEAVRASEERFRLLFEQSSDAHLIFTETEGIIDCNPAAVAMLRCPDKRAVLALHPAALSPELQPDGRRSMEKSTEMDAAARRNGHHRFDWLHRRFDGEVFPCEVTLTPVRLGDRSPLLVVWHDLTERVRAEERVRASLREKEVLLKEIHHRVKNNLQIVSALLDLQSEHTTDPHTLSMFQESRGRVKSMALIHERLYRSHDMARVDFAEYVRQLAADLYRSYKVSDDDIRLELDVDTPPLPIDVAIPCGLLLNELMSNCFKHAFKDATSGCVRVALRRDDGSNVFIVSDDGVGFPVGIDFRNTGSFGLQLVNTLVDQLDGRVELAIERGTTFTIRFPRSPV